MLRAHIEDRMSEQASLFAPRVVHLHPAICVAQGVRLGGWLGGRLGRRSGGRVVGLQVAFLVRAGWSRLPGARNQAVLTELACVTKAGRDYFHRHA